MDLAFNYNSFYYSLYILYFTYFYIILIKYKLDNMAFSLDEKRDYLDFILNALI